MKKLLFVKVFTIWAFAISLMADFYVNDHIDADDIYVGQMFELHLQTISLRDGQNIYFDFEGAEGVRVLNPMSPLKTKDNIRTTYTFFLQANQVALKTPDVVISIIESDYSQMRIVVQKGKRLQATTLNPPQNFSGILAKDLNVKGFQTSIYDESSNIVAVKIEADYGNLDGFTLADAWDFGIKSSQEEYPKHLISFYAMFDRSVDSLNFSYFNLDSREYKTIDFPIDIQRDVVSTQTQLHMQQSRVYQLKLYGSIGVAVVFALLFLFFRSYTSLAVAIGAIIYLIVLIKPLASVVVKQDTIVYIVPTKNATAIVKLDSQTQGRRLGEYGGYIKIEFDDGLIGWIKEEGIGNN